MRALLGELGGTAENAFWLINAFPATFPSADSVQTLATHPDVVSIELDMQEGGIDPP